MCENRFVLIRFFGRFKLELGVDILAQTREVSRVTGVNKNYFTNSIHFKDEYGKTD